MNIEYKNIDEQIEQIKAKNIVIKNEEKAKEILIRENYYNLITGYKDIFINMKMSKKTGIETCDEETFFEEIYAVYKFDRDFRNLIFKCISIVETNIKSYISNIFSKKYGTKDYLKRDNFEVYRGSEARFDKLMKTIKESIARSLEYYEDMQQCYQEYGDIPFWMLGTLLTFGTMVKFYIFMKKEDKEEVARILDMQYTEVSDYLKMLNIVRNITAHNNILFNTKFNISYCYEIESNYHETAGIQKQENIYTSGLNDMMAIIIILRRFLNDREYYHLSTELIEMLDEVKEELDSESFENLLEEIGLPKTYNKIELLHNEKRRWDL